MGQNIGRVTVNQENQTVGISIKKDRNEVTQGKIESTENKDSWIVYQICVSFITQEKEN